MSVLESALLGFIQGLGEFLPISSSGHLLLARIFCGIQTDSPAMKMLDILLHVGTLLPVLIVFRKEWIDMILHPVRNKTLLLLVLASVPTLAVYLAAKKLFPAITAVFLIICDKLSSGKRKGSGRVGIFQAVVMGLFQGIGMIPGVSRSGSTILGGVSTGLDKSTAARFSFMMSAPAIVGSLLMEGKDALEAGYIKEISLIPSVVGIIVAAVVGYAAIRFMLRIITRIPLSWFALYLAVIGILFLVLQLSGNPLVPSFSLPSGASGL